MSFSEETNVIIASNLTVAYYLLFQAGHYQGKQNREELIKKEIISRFKDITREIAKLGVS